MLSRGVPYFRIHTALWNYVVPLGISYDASRSYIAHIKIPNGTIKKRKILLVDYSNFIADGGAFLGLYLGASVLSLTDSFYQSDEEV